MAVCSSNIIRFTSIHKITEQNATRYIMPTIFILLLFSQKNTKHKKKVKKKTCLFTTFYLATQTNSHSFFFLLINYAVKKKLQCRERRKGENEGFSFPSSLNIHNISLLWCFLPLFVPVWCNDFPFREAVSNQEIVESTSTGGRRCLNSSQTGVMCLPHAAYDI